MAGDGSRAAVDIGDRANDLIEVDDEESDESSEESDEDPYDDNYYNAPWGGGTEKTRGIPRR